MRLYGIEMGLGRKRKAGCVVVSGGPRQGETEDFIGSAFQKVEEALVNPGSSALRVLRQVSFKVF